MKDTDDESLATRIADDLIKLHGWAAEEPRLHEIAERYGNGDEYEDDDDDDDDENDDDEKPDAGAGDARDGMTLLKRWTEGLRDHLHQNPCVVLQGPPGTGKTFLAEQLVKKLAKEAGSEWEECRWTKLEETLDAGGPDKHRSRLESLVDDKAVVWEIVQLHPGYTYEDLVRGLVTDSGEEKGGIRFVPVDRIVVQMAEVAAAMKPGGHAILILDEINRCNLASVLGELILVLEKSKRVGRSAGERGSDGEGLRVKLQYPPPPEGERTLGLPANLWIIGTMNTADRSIALVDYAIRRRFRFVDVVPDRKAIEDYYAPYDNGERLGRRAAELFEQLNEFVKENRLKIGHSYFLECPELDPVQSDEENIAGWSKRLASRIAYEVIPLLKE
jgi:5-methylcytosine-specific restriction endonuclease McrBC GTP-binding regulatory subunit McrB